MSKKLWLGGASGAANDPNTSANWLPPGVPTNSDDVYVEANPSGTDYDIITNLTTTFAGITLASFNVSLTYTGNIGIADTGTSSTTTGYLLLGGTNSAAISSSIGYQYGGTSVGNGSNLIRLNFGSMRAAIDVVTTSQSSAMANAGPITILGTHTSNTMQVRSGSVSVAVNETESATFLTVNNNGTLFFGPGVTLTTVNAVGGNTLIQSGAGTITLSSGGLTIVGSGTISAMTILGGSAILTSTGTLTNLVVQSGVANFATSTASRTVTNCTIGAGGPILNINNGVKGSVIFTNPIVVNASPGQYQIIPCPNVSVVYS